MRWTRCCASRGGHLAARPADPPSGWRPVRRTVPARMTIAIQIASKAAGIPAAAQLRKWARAALEGHASLTLRVANRAEAQRLHRSFRHKDYATNVLTFVYAATAVAADIVLCAQVVAHEARDQGKSLPAHYAHLTIHGVLHAQGFDHEKSRDARRMEAREIAILSKLGFANPYQASA